MTATLANPVDNETTICLDASGIAYPSDIDIVGLSQSFLCMFITTGSTQQSFTVTGRQDQEIESVETVNFAINGNSGPNVNVVGGPVSIDVSDDDIGASISLGTSRMEIDEAGTLTATVTATLSNPVNNETTVCVTPSGSASASDYQTTLSGGFNCLFINAGATQQTFTVTGVQDQIEEPVETITFTLNGDTGPNMTLAGMPISIDIIDDDGPTVADLGIHKFGSPDAQWVNGLAWEIMVVNNGPDAITGAQVRDAFSSNTGNIQWTCTGTDGGNCANVSGAGDIDQLVDLPANAAVMFEVCASLVVYDENQSLTNTATVTAPADSSDPDMNNNSSTATISDILLFSDGFEERVFAPSCFN